MRKLFITLSIVLLVLPFFSSNALAHPGRTDSNGGHTCRTNCAKWGLQTGEYHYHNGGSNTSSTPTKSPPKPTYSQADVEEGKTNGRSQGYEDGYSRNAINQVPNTGNEGFKKGYTAGYEAGYQEGLKKIKEEDSTAGTSAGKKDGKTALRQGKKRETTLNEAKSADWNSAYNDAFIKSFDYEKIVQDSEKSGYELGYSLTELAIPAEFTKEEAIKQTFESNYKTGYEKRMKEENDKHIEIGNKDGYTLSMLAVDTLDTKFRDFYKKGYQEGKSKRKDEVVAEGYQSAFINMNYLEKEEYDNPELSDWYKQGFDSNEIARNIKETAFDNGYTNSDYTIPKEFKVNEESIALYDSLFQEGQELKSQEKYKKMMVTTGIALPAGGIAVGGLYFSRRNKRKKI